MRQPERRKTRDCRVRELSRTCRAPGPSAEVRRLWKYCVSVQVNIFGFLATRELSAADPRGVSGNYGFQDAQEALRWVQRNIAVFGGDPSKVQIRVLCRSRVMPCPRHSPIAAS
jgi:acetyl esterase/lipase